MYLKFKYITYQCTTLFFFVFLFYDRFRRSIILDYYKLLHATVNLLNIIHDDIRLRTKQC